MTPFKINMCFPLFEQWLQGISASLNELQASLLEKQKVQMAVPSHQIWEMQHGIRERGESNLDYVRDDIMY